MSKDLPRRQPKRSKKRTVASWCRAGEPVIPRPWLWSWHDAPDKLREEYSKRDSWGHKYSDHAASPETKPPRRKRFKVRCSGCNKRLLPKVVHCVGGEIHGWIIPRHKEKL